MIYIITPIYNAEKFIVSTVDSVQKQTINDWNLVLVNDCSTDGTLDVVGTLAKQDNRIIVLNAEENGGPSKARNIGIKYALEHGADYLAFIDSDDLYEPVFLEEMQKCADNTKADISWCDYVEDYMGSSIPHLNGENVPDSMDASQFARLFFQETPGLCNIWSKMYKAEFIKENGIMMNENRVCGEDWEFNYSCCMAGASVSHIAKPLYHYVRQNGASVMASYHKGDYQNHYDSLQLEDWLAQKYDIAYDKKDRTSRHLYWAVSIICSLANSRNIIDKNKELCSITRSVSWLDTIKEGNYDMRYMSCRNRLYFWLLKHKFDSLCLKIMKK